MTDGLAGFTTGFAKGTDGLVETVNQDRARQQQQGQFDTQVATQKDQFATTTGIEQARGGIVQDPTSGKYVIDPNSPVGQELKARVDASNAGTENTKAQTSLTNAQLKDYNDPTMRALRMRGAVAGTVSAEGRAKTDVAAGDVAVEKEKQSLESGRLENVAKTQSTIMNAWNMKDYPANKAIEKMKAFSGLANDAAQRESFKAGIKRGETEIAGQTADRAFRAQRAAVEDAAKARDEAFQQKRLDAETKSRQDEYAMHAQREITEGRKALINGYMGTLAQKYGTRIPAQEIQRVNKFADQLFPMIQDHARLGVSLEAQDKHSVALVSKEFDEIAGVANAIIGSRVQPTPEAILRFKSLVESSKKRMEDLSALNGMANGAPVEDLAPETDANLLAPLPETVPDRVSTLDLRSDLSEPQRAALRAAYIDGGNPLDYLRKNDNPNNWIAYKGHPIPIPFAKDINIENEQYNGIGASPLWNRKFTRPLDMLVQPLQNIVDEGRMITKTAFGGETKIVSRFIDAAVKDDSAYEKMYQEVVSKPDSPLQPGDSPLSTSTVAKVFEYVLHNELKLPLKSGKKSMTK